MGKLVFAGFVLLVGLALYGVARRQALFQSGPMSLLPRVILALAVGVPALIFLFSIFRIIPAGQVGVKVLFGQVDPVPLREGLNVLWNRIAVFDAGTARARLQRVGQATAAIDGLASRLASVETKTNAPLPAPAPVPDAAAPYTGPTVGVSDRVRRAPTVGYRWSLQ